MKKKYNNHPFFCVMKKKWRIKKKCSKYTKNTCVCRVKNIVRDTLQLKIPSKYFKAKLYE